MQIEIDFEVYKILTAMRRTEEHSYNDVLRELLSLPPRRSDNGEVFARVAAANRSAVDAFAKGHLETGALPGLHSRGLYLPDGSELRATYKGSHYRASVKDGVIVSSGGKTFTSPSAAAGAITETTVNGWRFWEAKRPNDIAWYRLDQLP